MSLLSDIQQKLKAPKDKFNSFGGYYYRSAEGILEAVKPLLNGAELILSDEIVVLGNGAPVVAGKQIANVDRYYVKATVRLVDGDKEWSATAYAREAETNKCMDAAQSTGAASSHARKYALQGLFLLDDGEDPDSQNKGTTARPAKATKTGEPALATDKQRATVNRILSVDMGYSGDEAVVFLEEYFGRKVDKNHPLTKTEASKFLDEFMKKTKKSTKTIEKAQAELGGKVISTEEEG